MGRSIDFFRDEVRNGFYIPTAIKQGWAAALDVLSEIDTICKNHDITYFADWGTFLGAVRHGGFVPWDDDLDICMLRDDYVKFREVADRELPDNYVIHDFERKENHWLFLSRVVNNSRMCFDVAYLDRHNNFPWLAGVDIFVKDYLYPNDEDELQRDKEIMNILAVADSITEGGRNRQAISERIKDIEEKYHIKLPDDHYDRDTAVALYKLAERRMSEVNRNETDRVGQIFPWILKSGPSRGERKELYENLIRLPFEDISIPVPASYNTVLASRYGNYSEIHKVWSGHDYPFFEGQKKEMEQLSGRAFMGFSFESSMLERKKPDKSRSLKRTVQECVKGLQDYLHSAEDAIYAGNLEVLTGIITDAQQLAADMGTLVEQVKGLERACTKNVTEALQKFCDSVYEDYCDIAGGMEKDRLLLGNAALARVIDCVRENITDRREILMLPVGIREWTIFGKIYEELIKDENTDIYVVPLPLIKKSFLGKILMGDEEIEALTDPTLYPDGIIYTDWREYDISIHCPDVVYIQNPYDGVNPVHTVPRAFYAENIQVYADRIVYVPIAKTAEFGKEDLSDLYNLKHYVTAPGIIYADEVIVQSDNIKEQYINALKGFAGEDTEDVWKNKITVKESLFEIKIDKPAKRMFFCIGANELTEHGDILIQAVRDRLGIFKESASKLSFSIALYPDDRSLWTGVNEQLSKELFDIIDSAMDSKEFDEIHVTAREADSIASCYDAYYGNPSPFVPAFTAQKKPVMIADLEVEI